MRSIEKLTSGMYENSSINLANALSGNNTLKELHRPQYSISHAIFGTFPDLSATQQTSMQHTTLPTTCLFYCTFGINALLSPFSIWNGIQIPIKNSGPSESVHAALHL